MGLSSAFGGAVGVLPAGAVIPYAGSAAPAGWLFCGGQAVNRSDYAALFAAIGTTYGVGDGSTTFNLPDLRGRVIAGEDDMGGTAANRLTSGGSGVAGATLGASGGAETVTLTSAQSGVPAHQHANTVTNNAVTSGTHSADHSHSGTTGGHSSDHSHGGTTGTMNSNWSHGHGSVYNGHPSAGALDGTILAYGTTHDAGWRGVYISATDTNHTHNFSTGGVSANHTHGITTGGVSANHTHSVTSNVAISNVNNTAANAASAHTNTQPTIVLNYIIKAVAF